MEKELENITRAFVVSHTHWDREWYRTYQSFRIRLVSLMDELVREMSGSPDFRWFHLDGQTIPLEDYVEVRPEMRAPLERLIRDGRIIIGPWYVMPDEFLVSGESLVRNLLLGRSVCRGFGAEPMPVGYVVDVFGHNSQLPQILRGFDIDSAVLYRGIGDYPKDLFTWVGLDGSRVLVAKLDSERSYSNFYFALRHPFDDRERTGAEVLERARDLVSFAKERASSENVLMMDGCDHIEMDPQLPQLLKSLNDELRGPQFIHARLVDYLEAQKALEPEPAAIHGELYHVGRRGLNNQLLKNVLSSMVQLKQMNDVCELALTRWAEPFAAALGHAGAGGFLAQAWRLLLQNHPHDSICGCSITRVHEDNVYRFNQVADIAEGVIATALEEMAARIDSDRGDGGRLLIVANAGQREHGGMLFAELVLPRESLGNLRLHGAGGERIPFQLVSVDRDLTQGVFRARRLPEFRPSVAYRIVFAAVVPAVGYACFRYEDVSGTPGRTGPDRAAGTMRVSSLSWENDYYLFELDRGGRLSLTEKTSGRRFEDLFHYEDAGDVGDGWNYRAPSADGVCLSGPASTDVHVEADGPFAVVIGLTHRLAVPERSGETRRSDETRVMAIHTRITMLRDSRLIGFETAAENRCTDHRLRVVFPTCLRASRYLAATPFAMQERPVAREDTRDAVEWDSGVAPSQGVTVLSDDETSFGLYTRGLYEVEVSEDSSRSLALTLFRSFSREVGRSRGEMSLMVRSMRFEYAVDVRPGSASTADMFVEGLDWRAGLRSRCSDLRPSDLAPLSPSASFLDVRGEGVVLSSFRADGLGRLVLRVYNALRTPTEGVVKLPCAVDSVTRLRLDEETAAETGTCDCPDDRSLRFRLGPAEVATFAAVPGPARG